MYLGSCELYPHLFPHIDARKKEQKCLYLFVFVLCFSIWVRCIPPGAAGRGGGWQPDSLPGLNGVQNLRTGTRSPAIANRRLSAAPILPTRSPPESCPRRGSRTQPLMAGLRTFASAQPPPRLPCLPFGGS